MVRLVLVVVGALIAAWVLFVLALAIARPRDMSLADAKRLVPDTIRLLRALAKDSSLPKGVRRHLGLLLVYLALPIDIVPDFIPVLGYADDVIVIGLVTRSVIRSAGADALTRHWEGSLHGLELLRRLAGIR